VTTDPQAADPKVRRTWGIAGSGAVAGLGLALVSGALGGSGRVGLVIFLLITAAASGLAALYAILTAVIDDLKQRPVSRRRPIAAITLFVVAALLMAMVAAAGG
jgi:hypothetical protein